MATGGKYVIKDLYDAPDSMFVLWEYPDNWTLEYTLRQANGQTADGSNYGIMFHGTDAAVYLDRSGYQVYPEGNRARPKKVGTPRKNNFMPRSLSVPHIRNFLDCVKSRQRPTADVEIGHRATIVPHLGNIAVRTGHRLTWNAESETLVDDPVASKLLTRDYRQPYELPAI